MERIIDITCLLAMCLISAVADAAAPLGMPSPALVACFLAATTTVFLCEWSRGRAGALGLVAYCALATLRPEGILFLPAATYGLVRFAFEPMPWRSAPLAAAAPWLAACLAWRLPAPSLMAPALMTALSVLLSARTGSLVTQRALRRRTRDEYRERELCAEGEARAVPAPPHDPVRESSETLDERCRGAFPGLTDREYEVVSLVAEGMDNREISSAAFISEGTVRNRISAALQKTGCKNRTQLAVRWWKARA